MEGHENLNLAAEAAENVDAVSTEEIIGQEEQENQTVQSEVPAEEKVYTEAEFNKKLDEVLAKKIAIKTDMPVQIEPKINSNMFTIPFVFVLCN